MFPAAAGVSEVTFTFMSEAFRFGAKNNFALISNGLKYSMSNGSQHIRTIYDHYNSNYCGYKLFDFRQLATHK